MHWLTLDGAAPRIIAHRGASGLRPEHTIAAYALGLAQGADVIEPDLIASADGVLFARHEYTLARSTDIATRPELAAQRRDGDWHGDTLSAAQIDGLRARQPYPGRSRAYDGRFPIPRFAEVIAWADAAASASGIPTILYPELKAAREPATADAYPAECFVRAVQTSPPNVRLWVQCFDAAPLRRIHDATGLPCTLLLDAPDDWHAAITLHGSWLTRLGVHKRLLDQGVVAAAHARGLAVDAWTFRDDTPASVDGDIHDELHTAMRLGVDGLFCDFPATGVAVRNALQRGRV